MILGNIVSQSLEGLTTNRLRSILTMLGVVWGTASVVFLLGWGRGFVKVMETESRLAGDGWAILWPKRALSETSGRKGARQLTFELEDVDAILKHCPSVRYASPVEHLYTPIKYGSALKGAPVFGVDVDAQNIFNLDVEHGRFLQPDDCKHARRVCVLGATLNEGLFPPGYAAVGERVKIRGISFEVIGVLKKKGDQLVEDYGPDDEKVYIPTTSFMHHLSGSRTISQINVQPQDTQQSKVCIEEVRTALAKELDFSPDDKEAIEVIDISSIIVSLDIMALIIAVFITIVGVITLFVGGVGVMNIMLVSVTERTREIGLRKAIGAKRRHVLSQFLIEALAVTTLSGIIGIALGCAVSLAFAAVPRPKILAAPEISLITIAGSFLVMVVVGLFAGTLPA
ncbi:MAG: ABC transporter permease, partial [Candidatus Hydrogenedentota bacterium]